MDLMQVNGGNLQALQAVFAFFADRLRRERWCNLARAIPRQNTFGKDIWLSSGPALQRPSDDFFGVTQSVHGSGIDPVYAKFQPPVNRRYGISIILLAPGIRPACAANRPRADPHRCDV